MACNADTSMRLDRLLVTLAAGSRSKARDIIKSGRVKMNGCTVRSPDTHVSVGDLVMLDGQLLDARTQRHVMLNKPCGILTSARDKKQQTVMDLLPAVYASCGCMPAGRLDKDTEGLLLLTTDGELSHRLLSPERHVWKCYLAVVAGNLTHVHIQAFGSGIPLSDFTAKPARLEILSAASDRSEATVWVREGKYHQVRRMFDAVGHPVISLKRTVFGPLVLDQSLLPGMYRELTEQELFMLHHAAYGEEDT